MHNPAEPRSSTEPGFRREWEDLARGARQVFRFPAGAGPQRGRSEPERPRRREPSRGEVVRAGARRSTGPGFGKVWCAAHAKSSQSRRREPGRGAGGRSPSGPRIGQRQRQHPAPRTPHPEPGARRTAHRTPHPAPRTRRTAPGAPRTAHRTPVHNPARAPTVGGAGFRREWEGLVRGARQIFRIPAGNRAAVPVVRGRASPASGAEPRRGPSQSPTVHGARFWEGLVRGARQIFRILAGAGRQSGRSEAERPRRREPSCGAGGPSRSAPPAPPPAPGTRSRRRAPHLASAPAPHPHPAAAPHPAPGTRPRTTPPRAGPPRPRAARRPPAGPARSAPRPPRPRPTRSRSSRRAPAHH